MKGFTAWEFNIWDYPEEELSEVAEEMFRSHFEEFRIEARLLPNFIAKIQESYHANPYHNFRHALDVTQFVYKLDYDGVLKERFDSHERFSLLLAAIGHDLGHPGTSNSFHREFHTELTEKYGPESTLERFHADMMIKIIEDPEFDLLGAFQPSEREKMKSFIQHLIFSTDMAIHDNLFEKMKGERIRDHILLGSLVLKCADLGQLIRSKEISERWIGFLCKEKENQRNEEAYRGKVDPRPQEEYHKELIASQSSFVERYARPLFQLLGENFSKLQGIDKRVQFCARRT